jgi:large subunit ribosomal protein L7/L12
VLAAIFFVKIQNTYMNEKLTNIIEQLKTLTLLEAAELVTQIEQVFGVDTSVSVGAAVAMPVAQVAVAAEAVEEKTAFDIVLEMVPADKKIAILKIVRNVTGLGLKESKDIVDNVPKTLKEGSTKDEVETIKKELEAAGAKVTVK